MFKCILFSNIINLHSYFTHLNFNNLLIPKKSNVYHQKSYVAQISRPSYFYHGILLTANEYIENVLFAFSVSLCSSPRSDKKFKFSFHKIIIQSIISL